MADKYRAHVSETDDQGNKVPTPPATAADAAPQTPEAKPAGFTLNFKDVGGGEISFKLKPTTKLKKAMDAYAMRTERNRNTLRFLFDGTRVTDDSTPENMEMEDGDVVDVHTEQFGGGREGQQH